MLLNSVLRFCLGSVHFRACNGFGERLINLCASNNIGLTNIVKTQEGFEAVAPAYDFKKLEQFAKKVNVEVLIIHRRGLPFKAKRFKKRLGLILGIFVFVVVILFSQNFVWEVEVVGNEKVPSSIILSELKNIGIHKWAYIPNLDVDEKKEEALICLPQLSWLALTKSGCKIQVQVTERFQPPIINENEPCDIVASKTGQIKYVEVYCGERVIGLNYTVNEGDLIISGTFINKFGDVSYVHSDAKIIAEVQFDKTLELDIAQLAKEYTGKVKKRNYLEILSLKLPLFISTKLKGSFDATSESHPLRFFSHELPIGVITNEYRFYEKKGEQLTRTQAKKILDEKFKEYEQQELKDSAIIERKISSILKNGVYKMKISYTIEQDIAQKRELNTP